MITAPPLTAGAIHVWHCTLDGTFQNPALISHQERAVARTLAMRSGRATLTRRQAFLRAVLGSYLNIEPGAVPISRERCWRCGGSHGKPYLLSRDIEFNLSSTLNTAVCALALHPVGIDVEFVHNNIDWQAVVTHTVSDFFALNQPQSPERAARLWVRFEAAIKFLGIGLLLDRDLLHIPDSEQNAWACGRYREASLSVMDFCIHKMRVAVASGSPGPVIVRAWEDGG